MSLGHSWRKPEVGLVAGNSLSTLVHLINWVGSSYHICRDIEGAGKWSLEVYDTVAEAHHVYEVVKLRGPEVTPKKCSVLSKCVRYDLNQIPYDYTVEVRNRFKGLDLIDKSAWWTMDRGSWHCTGDRDQDHPHGKEMQKSKMAVWGGLTNSCEKKGSEKQRRKGQI